MTTQQTTQTNGAAAPEGAAQPSPSGNGLAELLKEFDTADGKPPSDPIARVINAFKPVADYVAEERETKVVESVKQGVKEAVDYLGEAEETKALPAFWRKAFLEEHALQNPSMTEAFNNRKSDPDAWKTALKSARDALVEQAKGLPPNTVHTDLGAAQAAVSGRSNQVLPDRLPTPLEMANMSDDAFDQLKAREAAKYRS